MYNKISKNVMRVSISWKDKGYSCSYTCTCVIVQKRLILLFKKHSYNNENMQDTNDKHINKKFLNLLYN